MWNFSVFICLFIFFVGRVWTSFNEDTVTAYPSSVEQRHYDRPRVYRDDNITSRINATEAPPQHCTQNALTDGFGIITQSILAVLAFSSLVLKRLREPRDQRRSWTIWFYDTSKQALGAGVIHMVNVFLSTELFQNDLGDPCISYIIYFLLDSTFGLFFIYVSVKISQCIVKLCNCKTLYFGEYGTPPKCEAWVGQCGLFVLIVVIEKVFITLFASLKFWSEVAKTLLSPIHNERIEVVIVMLIVPFVLNAIMFWVVDNFLMRKHKKPKKDNNNMQARYYKLEDQQKSVDGSSGAESEGLLSPDEENREAVILTHVGTSRGRVKVAQL